jgi:hypothetical protein
LHWQQESNVNGQDQLAAECLDAEIIAWTSLWRSNDEGYALGLVNPDLNIEHPTSVTSRDVRLLAHGTCTRSGSIETSAVRLTCRGQADLDDIVAGSDKHASH